MRTLIFAALMAVVPVILSPLCHAQEPATTAGAVANPKQGSGNPEQMRALIKQLTTENEHLHTKIAELERRLKNHSIRDRMTQEEQRAENLQAKLFATAQEEAHLQTQLDEVNEQLRPENLQQLQVMGSLRPEEVREATRRKLTNQQSRIQAQLQLLQQSRTRLQSSVSVTDMLIQNLRSQMQAASHP